MSEEKTKRLKALAAFEDARYKCVSEFRELREMIVTFYGVATLSQFDSVNLNEIKQFCVGLLENPDTHPWCNALKDQPERVWYGVAHTLFLFRKRIPNHPDDRDKSIASMVNRLTTPSEKVDKSFLSFIEKEIPRLFPRGWDRKYVKRCSTFVLSTKSTSEYSACCGGGARGHLSRKGLRYGVDDFICRLSPLLDDRVECSDVVTPLVVDDGGKYRVLTMNPFNHHALRPLHTTLYDHLSAKSWLLRGDPKKSRFEDFTRKHGEEFFSGDYEAATDNVPIEVYRTMMRCVEEQSTHIPSSIWSLAYRQSVRRILHKGKLVVQQRGQLMGSYCSFPFLCLLNYLCFKYSIPRRGVPVKINGDDIVFRASPEEGRRWMDTVSRCGLILSKGKTLVHPRVFTLNSTIFRAKDNTIATLPFIRSKAFFKTPERVDALGGQYRSCVVGGPVNERNRLKAKFLRRHKGVVLGSQRSLTHGCGLNIPEVVLRLSGFWKREHFYLSLQREPDLPPPKSEYRLGKDFGWVHREICSRTRKETAEERRKYFVPELIDHCWSPDARKVQSQADYWEEVKLNTLRWRPEVVRAGIAKSRFYLSLKRLTRIKVDRWFKERKRRKKEWVPAGFHLGFDSFVTSRFT